jgi:hypothetical protein
MNGNKIKPSDSACRKKIAIEKEDIHPMAVPPIAAEATGE